MSKSLYVILVVTWLGSINGDIYIHHCYSLGGALVRKEAGSLRCIRVYMCSLFYGFFRQIDGGGFIILE